MKKNIFFIFVFASVFLFSCKKATTSKSIFEEGDASSSDASLKAIEVEVDDKAIPLSASFASNVYSYQAFVPYSTENVKVKGVPTNSASSVQVADSSSFAKEGGATKQVVISVVSQNQKNKKKYILSLIRGIPSKENRAASLKITYDNGKILALNEAFYSGRDEYSAFIPDTYAGEVSLTLFPYSAYAKSDVVTKTISGETLEIEGEVKAEDTSVTPKKYKVVLTRTKLFSNAESENLNVLSIEYKGKEAEYISSSNAYILYVPVQDEKTEIKTGIKVKSYAVASLQELDDLQDFPKVEKSEYLFILNISGGNGKNRNYKLILVRGEKQVDNRSGDASLEKIEFVSEDGDMAGIDCKQNTSDIYTYNVHGGISSFIVRATPRHEKASVSVSPQGKVDIALNEKKKIVITVKAENEHEKQYILYVEKSPNGMVKVLTAEMKITPRDVPFLNDKQQKNPMFKGSFTDDSITLYPYEIGMYEVNYKLWYEVREWAEQNGYVFQNKGCQGDETGKIPKGQANYPLEGAAPKAEKQYNPVTGISHRDMLIWCNAYSEMHDLKPCYLYDGKVLKDATWYRRVRVDVSKTEYINYDYYYADIALRDASANGYRLPTMPEWEAAARGGNPEKEEWNYAFPGVKGYKDGSFLFDVQEEAFMEVSEYAWYDRNSKQNGKYITHNVGLKRPNSLSLYDMAGSVYEMCEEVRKYENPNDSRDPRYNVFLKGGSYTMPGLFVMTSPFYQDAYYTVTRKEDIGFRLARSIN